MAFEERREVRKVRILYVPDTHFWVTATIARQIARHNPWIEPTVCSGPVLQKLFQKHGGWYPGAVDIVHFLTWQEAVKSIDYFEPSHPCVVTIHHVEDERSLALAERASAIMTVSREWYEFLATSGVSPSKLIQLQNGVETGLFSPLPAGERKKLRSRLGINANDIVVGFTAKETSNSKNRKGIETLIRAITELKDRIPGMRLFLVGPGWSGLIDQLTKHGVRCIYWPFVLNHKNLAQFYRSLDIFWVTARIEGGPVPLLEAMSSSTCCVTTPVGIAREAVAHGNNGFIAPIDDWQAFARETERLAGDADLRSRVGRAARETIVERFQWAKTSQAARELYKVAVEHFREQRGNFVSEIIPNDSAVKECGRGLFCSIPLKEQPWVNAQEHLLFANRLIEMKAKKQAFCVGCRGLTIRPFDFSLWRLVFRLITMGLPSRVRTGCSRWLRKAKSVLPGYRRV
jgi:glycosyltransferase involved in cell wall biosynthesis